MPGHVPRVAESSSGFVERDPAEVTRLLARHAIRLILVDAGAPVADKAHLRRGGRGR